VSIISILNIINTISTNLILRTQEISIYKAVGMTKFSIKKMTFFEALFYGINATIYGSIIAIGIVGLIFIKFNKIVEFEWDSSLLPLEHILIVGICSIGISILAGYIPLKRINDRAIMENIRGEE
ncbi:MAG: ABC transporter permease, partial [Clostridiales bacterium]